MSEPTNQCDGCAAGYPKPLNDNMHRLPNGKIFMSCTRDRYPTPTARTNENPNKEEDNGT